MKTRLSTSMTFFWKYIFSGLWLVGFGIGSILAIIELGVEGLIFLLGLAFGTALLYYGCMRAKKVEVDDKYLYVSNFKEDIKVPLSNIHSVYDNILFSPRPVFIEFKKETQFGRKIIFIGYTELFLFFRSHPAVKEIEMRVKDGNLR